MTLRDKCEDREKAKEFHSRSLNKTHVSLLNHQPVPREHNVARVTVRQSPQHSPASRILLIPFPPPEISSFPCKSISFLKLVSDSLGLFLSSRFSLTTLSLIFSYTYFVSYVSYSILTSLLNFHATILLI